VRVGLVLLIVIAYKIDFECVSVCSKTNFQWPIAILILLVVL